MTSQPTDAPRVKRRPAPWILGVVGLVLAVAAAVLQVLGIIQATGLNWQRGTLLAWLAIGVSTVAFLVGLIAIILNRGRRWGVAAMIVAIVANPWLLALLLGSLG
jgi:hypothetical protein